jgi:hypothetical protein
MSRVNNYGFYFDKKMGKYCFPFVGSDKSVVQRSQYLIYELMDQRPVQFMPYLTVRTLTGAVNIVVFGSIFTKLSNTQRGREMLLKVDKLCFIIFCNKKLSC